MAWAYTAKVALYSLLTDDRLILGDPSGGQFNVNLPAAVGTLAGKQYTVVNVAAANNVVLIPQGGALVNGAANYVIGPKTAVTVVTDGVTWHITAKG